MQLHLNKACFDSFGIPHLNVSDPDDPFVILPAGPLELSILSEDEADQLIARACQIKDMFALHAAKRSPIWAVVDSREGEVAGPMTHADAEKWASDSKSFFPGTLTVEPAVPELDAKLSPPAPGALSGAERAEATTPPGYTLPAGELDEDGAWREAGIDAP